MSGFLETMTVGILATALYDLVKGVAYRVLDKVRDPFRKIFEETIETTCKRFGIEDLTTESFDFILDYDDVVEEIKKYENGEDFNLDVFTNRFNEIIDVESLEIDPSEVVGYFFETLGLKIIQIPELKEVIMVRFLREIRDDHQQIFDNLEKLLKDHEKIRNEVGKGFDSLREGQERILKKVSRSPVIEDQYKQDIWNKIRQQWFIALKSEFEILNLTGIEVPVVPAVQNLGEIYISRNLKPCNIDWQSIQDGKLKLSCPRCSNPLSEVRGLLRCSSCGFWKTIEGDQFSIPSLEVEGYVRNMMTEKDSLPLRLWISGEAGIGKTIYLKYLILQIIKYYDDESNSGLIPFYVSLGRLGESSLRYHFIENVLQKIELPFSQEKSKELVSEWFDTLLDSGKIILLLDGLDELQGSDEAVKVMTMIRQFLGRHQNIQLILTSRHNVGELLRPYRKEFVNAELIRLSKEVDVPEFIRKWFNEERYGLNYKKLKQDLLYFFEDRRNSDILKLGQNPLLLTVICALHGSLGKIPRNRHELYKTLIKTLLDSWERIKDIEMPSLLSGKILRGLLEYIAYQLMCSGKTELENAQRKELIGNYWRLVREYPPEDIPTLVEKSEKTINWRPILLRPQMNVSVFFHRTIMEYLAACYLKDLGNTNRIWDEINDKLIENNWLETLTFMFSSLSENQIKDLVYNIHSASNKNSNVMLLIGRVLRSDCNVKYTTSLLILNELIRYLEQNPDDFDTGEALGGLYEPCHDILYPMIPHILLKCKKGIGFQHGIKEMRNNLFSSFSHKERMLGTIMAIFFSKFNREELNKDLLIHVLQNIEISPEKIFFEEIHNTKGFDEALNHLTKDGLFFYSENNYIHHQDLDEADIFRFERRFSHEIRLKIIKAIFKILKPYNITELNFPYIDEEISKFIEKSINLEELTVGYEPFEVISSKPLPYLSITKFPQKLVTLRLVGYTLDNLLMKKLPSNLTSLCLLNCDFEVPLNISHLVKLERINCMICRRVSPIKMIEFLNSIKNLSNLAILSLLINSLTEIPEIFASLVNLKVLDLSFNKLEGDTLTTIFEAKDLEYLNLVGNPLKVLPERIGELKSLKRLFLDNCSLTKLPKTIGELTNLQFLSLAANDLISIPKSLELLKELKCLRLKSNSLDRPSIEFVKKLRNKGVEVILDTTDIPGFYAYDGADEYWSG